MRESELIDDLATRARVSRANAEAVVNALADLARDRARAGCALSLAEFTLAERPPVPAAPPAYVPGDREVDDLIAAATGHPLGLDFLLEGDLCAVATMFRTHAFTVDAARARLRERGATLG